MPDDDNEYPTNTLILSRKDSHLLLDLIDRSVYCRTEQDFRNLVLDLKQLVQFDYAAALMGKKSPTDAVTQYDLINVSYPGEWLFNYVTKNYQLIDPIVKENFSKYSLQYWSETYKKYQPPKQFVKEAEDFDLRAGYSIGVRNLSETEGSLFSFSGHVEHHARTRFILKRFSPHLHRAFNQVKQGDAPAVPIVSLTAREKEILRWVKEGKSTWEISAILGISQNTVQFHMRNILQKLNVTKRSHALAIALGNKLIDL